jgi:NADPH:quinone reductase-like Zn-dependent oxidoreductase
VSQPVDAGVSRTPATGPLCRRLMITAPGVVELISEHLPPPGEHEVLIETVISGISHGTEVAWLAGSAAALHRSWDADLRIYRDGAGRSFPVAPGYESIGRVVEIGPAVSGLAPGDLVAVDAPHADRHLISDTAALAGRLPAGVEPERAVFFILTRVPWA